VGQADSLPELIMRRVVITGLGLVTPIGAGRELFWKNLTSGVNGIGPVESFDTSAFPVHIGAEVKDFDPSGHEKLGRGSQLAVAAARMALDAGVDIELPFPDAYPGLVQQVHHGTVSEAAVNRAGGRVPLPGRTVGEHPLQAADNVASGPHLQGRHGATVRKGGPGRRTNNAVDHQACAFLEVPDRSLSIRSKHAINSQAGIRSAPQGPLHPADYIAGRTRSDRWLSRIGQGSISLR